MTPFDYSNVDEMKDEIANKILTPSATSTYVNTLKNTLTSSANNEETKKLMEEIWSIRNEIKQTTMKHLKSDVSAPVMETSNISDKQPKDYIRDKENIASNSNKIIGKLRKAFHKNASKTKEESWEFSKYKQQFQADLEQMESELTLRMKQISYFNRQRLKDNKSMMHANKQEVDEITQFYENKLQLLRDENDRSKNNYKELVVNKEAELTRLNKEIDDIETIHGKNQSKFNEAKYEGKESMKVLQRQRQNNISDLDHLRNVNKELQKNNMVKLRHMKRLRIQTKELKEVNGAARIAIDKLKGVTGNKTKKQTSRNKTKRLNKVSSKAVIMPTKQFILRLKAKKDPKFKKKMKKLLSNSSKSALRRDK